MVRKMYCKQCKTEKPSDAFYPVRRGMRVTICFECAKANMAEWARTTLLTHSRTMARLAKDK